MKYDLSKLTKDEICILIKKISPAFAGIYCYAPSHKNKVVKNVQPKEKGIIELYDNERKIHDLWGQYDIVNNSLFVMAWDQACYWPVGVYLHENHFSIPKYKNSINAYETKKNFDNYTKILKQIFNKKCQNKINKSQDIIR